MSFMSLSRIKTLREQLEEECIDTAGIIEINEAFHELVKSGFELRDEPENALAGDQLDELEEAVSPLEVVVYNYVLENYGENEANFPCYDMGKLVSLIESKFEVREK